MYQRYKFIYRGPKKNLSIVNCSEKVYRKPKIYFLKKPIVGEVHPDTIKKPKICLKRRLQIAGFSLVELMVVIAIVGMLVAAAVPTFNDYMIRARAVEMMTVIEPMKIAIAEQVSMGVGLSEINTGKFGIEKIENRGVIKEVVVANGVITVEGIMEKLGIKESKGGKGDKGDKGGKGDSFKLIVEPLDQDGLLTWKCSVNREEYKKYAPGNCRDE